MRDFRCRVPGLSQKLCVAIVPADGTQVEFGDNRENGQEETWNPAQVRWFHRYTQTGSQPAFSHACDSNFFGVNDGESKRAG
jgi:hypothetical protein